MAWTSPKTWGSEVLTSSDLNTHLRDNLEALKDPPSDNYEADESSDYSTTSTSFVDVDATNFNFTITTTGGDVMVGFSGRVANASGYVHMDVDLDGTRIAADGTDGIVSSPNATAQHASFVWLVTGLSAGSHQFKLQFKCNSGTAVIYAGGGTAQRDSLAQFWVREVS